MRRYCRAIAKRYRFRKRERSEQYAFILPEGNCDDGRFLKMQGGPAAIETAINSHRADRYVRSRNQSHKALE